jgi:hypothetical protein
VTVVNVGRSHPGAHGAWNKLPRWESSSCCRHRKGKPTERRLRPGINHCLKPHLVRSTFDTRRADAIEGRYPRRENGDAPSRGRVFFFHPFQVTQILRLS